MKKYTGEPLLTKEAFDEYAKRLREERAKQFGMTLDEWDNAIINQTPVYPVSGSAQ